MADVSKINGYNIKDATARAALGGKQDTISDLSTIRSGAALGATALQSVPSTYRTAAEQDIIDDTKSSVSVSATGTATDVVKYIIIDGVEKKLPSSEISPEILENFITAEDEDPSSPASKDADTLGGHIPAYYAQKEYVDTQLAQKYVKPSGGIPTADIANNAVSRSKLANDALYSPLVKPSTTTLAISTSEIGKTIADTYANRNSALTWTISKTVLDAFPIGAELAFARTYNVVGITITTTGARIINRDSGQRGGISTSVSFILPEKGSMCAMKKLENDTTYGSFWILTGDVEIV